MNNGSIGILDSGAGGLCVARELHRLMPDETVIYLGDTANAPYGGHSKELVASNAARALAFFQQTDVKLIISTSGTISTVLSLLPDALKKVSVPFISTLLPCAQEACALSVHGVIGVVGATTAIRTAAFGKTIRNIRTDARVMGKACPLLTPIAESGAVGADNHLLRLAVKQYMESLLGEGIDTLILGSPHYSVLFGAISDVLGYGVTLIDCASVTARYVQSYLVQNDMLGGSAAGSQWYVTDALQDFIELSKLYYGKEIKQEVKQIKL